MMINNMFYNFRLYFKRLKKLVFNERSRCELSFDAFIYMLLCIKNKVSIENVSNIFNVYSYPVDQENKEIILNELRNYKRIGEFKIELGDFVSIRYYEMKSAQNLLLVSITTPVFDRFDVIYEDSNNRGVPNFAIRKLMEYSNGYFYCISDVNCPPVFISEQIIRDNQLL